MTVVKVEMEDLDLKPMAVEEIASRWKEQDRVTALHAAEELRKLQAAEEQRKLDMEEEQYVSKTL